MSFLLDVSDSQSLKDRFETYQAYVRSLEASLPSGAYAFATAPWHYDFEDSRCTHDAWLESVRIVEPATGSRHELRRIDIHVRLLGAYHDGNIDLEYKNVHAYSLTGSRSEGHGDWLMDEVRLSERSLVIHEVAFSSGARWSVECEDIEYEWAPFSHF